MSSQTIPDIEALLDAAARDAGYVRSADGRVSEIDAAVLLGVAANTLRNWRTSTAPIPWHRIGGAGGRVTYRLHDLAEHIHAGRSQK